MSGGAVAKNIVRVFYGTLGRVTLCIWALTQLGLLTACSQKTPTPVRISTPTTMSIRHRDAFPLIMTADDLGGGYRTVEMHRMEPGKGWGDDTTRLSGYQAVFESGRGVFTRISSQVECYLSVVDAQIAYRAYHETLAARIRGNATYESIKDAEESLLGDWNRRLAVTFQGQMIIHYIFLRENVFVELALTGPESPEFRDRAARQARLLDERIYSR